MITYSIIQKSQLEGALRLDAEYYQPEYLELNSKIKNQKSKFLGELAKDIICGPFGSAILQEDYREEGIPLIRVAALNDWFVRDDNLVFIEESLSQEMKRYQVVEGDLVVSQRGTIAMFSKVTDRFPKWNISANLISIKKSKKINFDYLLTFLNSSYGISQLYRKLSGQVQPKITTDDVKQILVFIPSIEKQNEIADLIQQAWQKQEESKSFYSQTEDLLLEELRLKDFKPEGELSYVVNLSGIKDVHRLDAEYFQPKYKKLESRIWNLEFRKLGDIVAMKKGIEPGSEEYQEEGKLFIRVSSLSKNGIIDKDQKYLSEELYQKLKKDYEPKVGEVLLTKDATPGITYVLKEPIEGIISSGILRLIPKNGKVENEYLALCLNSIVGQMQAERDGGGSIIIHWKPEQIRNVLIPILPKPTQQKIADLVQKSHEARSKTKQLLEQAKQKVENLLEV
jgi:restriction endonuclease S subunit